MKKIILIGTYHKEKGICNHFELFKIIENINPEVIFEEKPASYYNHYYIYKNRSNLESDAINLYLEKYKVTQVLVDYETMPPETFFKSDQHMHEQIERRSYGYREIIDTNSKLIEIYGFKYLNSNECKNMFKALDCEIEETLKFINKEKLYEIRKLWNDAIEKRENEMIKNIYNCSKLNEYKTGLFLIGAAHIESIIHKIQEYNEDEKIYWNYSEYEGIL
jgi:hypothetical protein